MTVGNLQRALNIGITGVYITDRKTAEVTFVDFVTMANNLADLYEGKEEDLKPCFIVQ